MQLNTLTATFKRNLIIKTRAYPKDFFISSILEAIHISLFAYFMYHLLFSGNLNSNFADYTGTSDYMTYIIVGSTMYRFVVRSCLNVSRSLITEVREGTLDSLMLAPFKRIQYFLGNMLEQTLTTSGETLITILICVPFGVNFSNLNPWSTLLAFLISMVAYFSVSILLACVMLYFRDTYISQNTLFALMFLLCGVTFPIQYLPGWVQVVSKLIPVTASLEIIRNSTISGMGISAQINNFAQLLGLSIIYCIIGFKLLKHVEIVALEKIKI